MITWESHREGAGSGQLQGRKPSWGFVAAVEGGIARSLSALLLVPEELGTNVDPAID